MKKVKMRTLGEVRRDAVANGKGCISVSIEELNLCEAARKLLRTDRKELREIVGELNAIIKPILDFAKNGMQYKLEENKHKACPKMNPEGKGLRGWDDCPIKWLLQRLHEEVSELDTAIKKGNIEEIRNECADVGNFAMMIFDNTKTPTVKADTVMNVTSISGGGSDLNMRRTK